MSESDIPVEGVDERAVVARRHFVVGFSGLALFMAGGLALEVMHGLKVGGYLDVGNEMRRMMWTLAHAHGTLFSLIHVAIGAYVSLQASARFDAIRRASFLATAGTLLLPTGFFLGGLWHYGGDPGSGIFLVPVGAISMLGAMLILAFNATASSPARISNAHKVVSEQTQAKTQSRGSNRKKKRK